MAHLAGGGEASDSASVSGRKASRGAHLAPSNRSRYRSRSRPRVNKCHQLIFDKENARTEDTEDTEVLGRLSDRTVGPTWTSRPSSKTRSLPNHVEETTHFVPLFCPH